MINMHTKFEVSSFSRSRDILGGTKNLKWVTWRDYAPFRDVLSFEGWDLLFNPHIKFEMSTITCNKETKGKCKNSRFEPPFGGLRGNIHGSSMARWKACGRRPISAKWIFLASSHGSDTISRNLLRSAFSEGVGHFEHKFLVHGDVASSPSMDR